MPVDRSYIARNNAERKRLKDLIDRASDADLSRQMPDGWTVAGVLAHAAFWDQRILVLLDQWQHHGVAPVAEDEEDVVWINDSVKPLILALPPRRAAEVALQIAESVDRRVEQLDDDMVRRSDATGMFNFVRADHRSEHLDQIEEALKKKR